MTTNFPTGLDSFPNPTGADHLDDAVVLHSAQHSNVNDAIEALEAKVGISFSNVDTSLDYICRLVLLTETQHPAGRYREITYSSTITILPNKITWYADNTKTIKLIEKEYAYAATPPRVLPQTITLRIYDGTVSNVLKRTIQDTITYNKVFETSRNRTIT